MNEYVDKLLAKEPEDTDALRRAALEEIDAIINSGDCSNDSLMAKIKEVFTAFYYLKPKRFWRKKSA